MEYEYYYSYEDDLYNSKLNKVTEIKIKKLLKIYIILIIISIITILASLIYVIIDGFNKNLYFIIGFIAILIMYFLGYKGYKKVKMYINKPFDIDYQEEITLQITKKGIIEKLSDNYKYLYKWKNIKKINKNKNYFDIIMKKGSNIIIPLRIFNDENDLNNFLNLLKTRTHVPISKYKID